jgi:hypothetical protein
MAEIVYNSKKARLRQFTKALFRANPKIEARLCKAKMEVEADASQAEVERHLQNLIILGEIKEERGYYIHHSYTPEKPKKKEKLTSKEEEILDA